MDHSFEHSVFAMNRPRFLEADMSKEFLPAIMAQARKSASDRPLP